MKKYKRFVLVNFSDTHAGQSLGLLNPATVIEQPLPDGEIKNHYAMLNPAQKIAWELYTGHVDVVKDIADGDDIVVIHNGDLTQGRKYFDNLAYSDVYAQMKIAQENMRPLVGLPNTKIVRMSWGTPSHIFYQGASTNMVAHLLRQEYPEKNIKSAPHGLLTLGKTTIDYAHHGTGAGIRRWLKGNVFRYYLKSMMFDEFAAGIKPPDLVIRSHFHVKIEEKVSDSHEPWGQVSTTGIITPSYTFMSDYARMVTRSQPRVTLGMCAVEFINGLVYNVNWLTKTFDTRTKERFYPGVETGEEKQETIVLG